MKLKSVLHIIRRKIKGEFQCAKEDGMIVENGVSVMGGCNFGSEPYLITLHEKCRISSDVTFITHDGGTWAFRWKWDKYADVVKYGRIEIGKESFIGARSIIMPGVKIGNNCVVGAGSIVTHDVPDETVVIGVPARKICTVQEYAEKSLSEMPENFDKNSYLADKKKYLIDSM